MNKGVGNIIRLVFVSVLVMSVSASFVRCKKDEEPLTKKVERPEEKKLDKAYFPENVRPVLDDLHERTVRYFWDTNSGGGAEPVSGMIGEGADRKGMLAAGGTGFGVMAIVSGVERGWISRADASKRLQTMVRFLGKADRYKGAWSHWMSPEGKSMKWSGRNGGDLLETCLLMQGLLVAREYFNGSDAIEQEVRDSVNSFYATIEFNNFTNGQNTLHWSWYPAQNGEEELYQLPIGGYNEAQIAYVLGLAAPNNAITYDVYAQGWYKDGNIAQNRTTYGYTTTVANPLHKPMFLSHYSMLSMSPHQMEDKYMNYWDYSVKHALINRHYCVYDNEGKSNGYHEGVWGLTASYGEEGYSAHSPTNDKGIIAPTAAIGSFPFTPYYSMQVVKGLHKDYSSMYGTYGFYDAFCPSTGWKSNKYLAIDQGPIAVMIENYRSGLIWDIFMDIPEVKKGLQIANITAPTYKTGFPKYIINTQTGVYDMMMHPDSEKYEIDFYLESGGDFEFFLKDPETGDVLEIMSKKNYSAGENVLKFAWKEGIWTGDKTTLVMKSNSAEYKLDVVFH